MHLRMFEKYYLYVLSQVIEDDQHLLNCPAILESPGNKEEDKGDSEIARFIGFLRFSIIMMSDG